MFVLIFSAVIAGLCLLVGLLAWLVRWIFRRRPSFVRTLKWTLAVYLVLLPLLLFVGLPLLSARLIAYSGTRPQDRTLEIDPASYGCEFETVRFPSRDGLQLEGWWMAGREDRPVFLLAHGLFRDRKEVVERACRFNQLGYGALAYDLRRHGGSPGPAVSLGYQERQDVLGAYDWERARSRTGIVLLGVSMGATASLLALEELPREDLLAVVADSPFASLDETVGRHVHLFLGMPEFPFVPIFGWYLSRLGEFPGSRLDAVAAVARVQDVPILLIYGAEDERMPADTANAVFEAIAGPDKELAVFPAARHAQAWKTDPQRYVRVVGDFLDRAAARRGPLNAAESSRSP